jgi:hypothetical protein
MAIVVRPAGYTGSLQRIVWAQGSNVPVTAYLWGGGGGGGGNDSNPGGRGSGAGYSQANFVVNEGDIIEVAVGGQGSGGQSGVGNAAGGSAGNSYVNDFYFNTRDASTSPAVYPQFNSAYCTFLNTYGVWENPTSATVFDRTYTVNFPTTQTYQFTAAADNSARFFIDDVERFFTDSFTSPYYIGFEVPAGNHTIRILGNNSGGPGAVALTIDGGGSYSGGRGGNGGPSGSSGAGGGGGGATVVILNNVPIAAAGGGAGGGGGGNSGAAAGQSAPGDSGQAAAGTGAGQNGTNKSGDGGGGGAGGGGWGGGNGGSTPGGDQGGYAGAYGLSSGTVVEDPSGQTPGGISNPYWLNAGRGGGSGGNSGTTGYAVFEFDVSGTFAHVNGEFNPVNEVYVKANGVWNQVKSAYIKQSGTWEPVNGSTAPVFVNVPNKFGANPRDAAGGQGGGGGGGKIICTKLYELGLMSKEIYEADQAFGADLVKARPDIYNGYRAWAEIVVDWMDGNGPNMMPWLSEQRRKQITQQWSTSWAQEIATPWAEEMAYQMGRRESSNATGKAIMAVGTPICKIVGVWQRVIGPSKRPAGFGKGLMLIPVFVALKTVAVLGKLFKRK